MPVERLLERLSFHHVRVHAGAVAQRADATGHAILIDVDDEIEIESRGGFVAESDHVPELPGGVDVQQREWRFARRKRLERQMEQDGRILADRVQQNGFAEFRRHLTNDVYALGLQAVQMVQGQLALFQLFAG